MINPLGKRSGYSLMEMLCVMAVLAVLGGIVYLLLREPLVLEQAQREFHERMRAHYALADQFRADVAQAEKAPRQWQKYEADPQTMILHMRDGSHVVYRWQEEKLERRAFTAQEEATSLLLIGGSRVGVEFVREGEESTLLRLRLQAMREGSPLPGQALEIAAALGGDYR